MTSAAGVSVSTPRSHRGGRGSSPTAALHCLQLRPIPFLMAKAFVERHHYLHSIPGGTQLAFGIFLGTRLMGAVTLGAGPANAYRPADGAQPRDCLTLTRLCLDDQLPKNSESRALGVILRELKQHTCVKFLLTYADPAQGHAGTIYKANNWLYTGLSDATPLYDLGDGVPRHSRTLSQIYGTHSAAHFRGRGVGLHTVATAPKHRYLYFLDLSWRPRLLVPVLRYPKGGLGADAAV